MQPSFHTIPPKTLVGQRLRMSFSDNRTGLLWRGFMPRRKEIANPAGSELISMQVYDQALDISTFHPNMQFDKWAAVEVTGEATVPEGMEAVTLPGGLYAVFLYKGASSAFASVFQYIFQTWLPASGYVVDHRPHFEVMGEKYKNDHPDSEEEIWIPVKPANEPRADNAVD
jgi:AraC family transcriptional regulator